MASIASAGYVVGSPGFMSPEQANGEEVGPASDIFSLGAVLAFAATGEGPFGAGSAPELAYRLVYGPPRLDGLPGELRPLVGHCLAKDPARRPSAEELLAEVAAAQRAAGWLPKADMGSFARYTPPSPAIVPVPGPAIGPVQADPAASPHGARGRHAPRRGWRPLAAVAAAAGVVGGLRGRRLCPERHSAALVRHGLSAARRGDPCRAIVRPAVDRGRVRPGGGRPA